MDDYEEEYDEERIDNIGRNGNDGLHYDDKEEKEEDTEDGN